MEVATNNTVENRQEGTPPTEPEQPRQPERFTQTGYLELIEMMMELKEEFGKSWEANQKMMEDLHKKLDNLNKKLDYKEPGNKSKPPIETSIVDNEKNKEEVSLPSEDNGKQTENKEDSKALLSENKHYRNEENIQHKEAIIKSRCV